MIWLFQDFELLGILLHALALSLEVLTVGGLLFLLVVQRAPATEAAPTRRILSRFACALAATQAAITALSLTLLIADSGATLSSFFSAIFFQSGVVEVGGSVILAALMRFANDTNLTRSIAAIAAFLVMASSVAQSHAISQMAHRLPLALFTAGHHLGAAGWIGAMLFLLFTLRRTADRPQALRLARRYSAMAMVSVGVLVASGIGMAWFYLGGVQAIYGTPYGILLSAKIYLMLTMLLLGAGNWKLLRADASQHASTQPFLIRLRRFSEAELGLGFTAVLAAASLTAQPPAADIPLADQVSAHAVVQRMHWVAPRLTSPPFAALKPPSSMAESVQNAMYSNGSTSDAMDEAWSEYNHHWAGLIVLACALLAFAARALPVGVFRKLASQWPLLFVCLAIFIVLRADPENWPLGPRSFWQSFASPEVLEHRLYAVLITLFAAFEWAVTTGRWRSARASYAFPLLMSFGSAALLAHHHGFSDAKEETLVNLSHTLIAVLGASAGWAHWLELRLPNTRVARIAGRIWPLCLALVGLVLLDYRES